MPYPNLISRIKFGGSVSIVLHFKTVFTALVSYRGCRTDAVVYSLNLGAPRGWLGFMILRSINEIWLVLTCSSPEKTRRICFSSPLLERSVCSPAKLFSPLTSDASRRKGCGVNGAHCTFIYEAVFFVFFHFMKKLDIIGGLCVKRCFLSHGLLFFPPFFHAVWLQHLHPQKAAAAEEETGITSAWSEGLWKP